MVSGRMNSEHQQVRCLCKPETGSLVERIGHQRSSKKYSRRELLGVKKLIIRGEAAFADPCISISGSSLADVFAPVWRVPEAIPISGWMSSSLSSSPWDAELQVCKQFALDCGL